MKATAFFIHCLLVVLLLTNCQNQPKQPQTPADSQAETPTPVADSVDHQPVASQQEAQKPDLVNVTPDSLASEPIVPGKRPASKSSASKPIPAVPKGKIPNFDGIYASQQNSRNFNGIITIRDLGDYNFSFEIATSGAGGCKGKLQGKASIKEDGTATWSGDGCESLKFTFDVSKLKIEEKGCQKNHGGSCGFAGNYVSGTW